MNKIPVNFLRRVSYNVVRRYSFEDCSPYQRAKIIPKPEPIRVTVLGARSHMGRLLSLMLKQNELIDELRLFCPDASACGIGLELAQIDTNTKIRAYSGAELLSDSIQDVQVITVCTNLPETQICEPDYLEKIGYLIKNYATFAAEVNPNAIFCIGVPPINSLVPLVSEEYKKAGTYDHRKIIGISMAACCRANSIIACNLNQNPCEVRVPILGGLCCDTIVPIISQTKPKIDVSPVLMRALFKKIKESEDEILEEKCKEGTRGCNLLYAFAANRFITSLLKAIKGGENIYECAYVKQIGHTSELPSYMSSLVKLSKDGIAESIIPEISNYECYLLEQAADKLKKSISLGKSFVTGEFAKQPKRIPYTAPICEPPNLDFRVLKANVLKPLPDPCGKIKETEGKDPNLMRITQKAIKLSLEQEQRENQPKIPKKETRKFCKK